MLTNVLFYLLVFGLVAAQGAAVFGTAYLSLNALRLKHWLAKAAAMIVSWMVWIPGTVTGYTLTGGDSSFMKGGAVVSMLCATATVSSTVYALVWMLWPLARAMGSHRATP